MPLYEYECTRCHKRVEKIQSFSAEPLKLCEACGGALERLVSAPAIQFKGSGWYVTDYAKKSSSPAASGESKSESSSAAAKDTASSGAKASPAASSAPATTPSKSD